MIYGGGAILDPLPANKFAWKILSRGYSQWRSNEFEGRYGLDLLAIFEMARALKIEITEDLLNRIMIFERASIAVFRKEPFCDDRERERCSIKYGEHFAWACEQKICGEAS